MDAGEIANHAVAPWHGSRGVLSPLIGQNGLSALYRRNIDAARIDQPRWPSTCAAARSPNAFVLALTPGSAAEAANAEDALPGAFQSLTDRIHRRCAHRTMAATRPAAAFRGILTTGRRITSMARVVFGPLKGSASGPDAMPGGGLPRSHPRRVPGPSDPGRCMLANTFLGKGAHTDPAHSVGTLGTHLRRAAVTGLVEHANASGAEHRQPDRSAGGIARASTLAGRAMRGVTGKDGFDLRLRTRAAAELRPRPPRVAYAPGLHSAQYRRANRIQSGVLPGYGSARPTSRVTPRSTAWAYSRTHGRPDTRRCLLPPKAAPPRQGGNRGRSTRRTDRHAKTD